MLDENQALKDELGQATNALQNAQANLQVLKNAKPDDSSHKDMPSLQEDTKKCESQEAKIA